MGSMYVHVGIPNSDRAENYLSHLVLCPALLLIAAGIRERGHAFYLAISTALSLALWKGEVLCPAPNLERSKIPPLLPC